MKPKGVTAQNTLSLRGGVGLAAVFHHFSPPLKDAQELHLRHIPAHSSPGHHSTEGLVLHSVLVSRVDRDAAVSRGLRIPV